MIIHKHTTKSITKSFTKKHISSRKFKIGCHASIIPSVLNSIKYVDNIGGNVVQIFMGNNRSSSLKTKTKLSENDIQEIREYLLQHDIILIIHSIYMLNFCNASPYSNRIKYMHDNIQYDLTLGSQLSAKYVILHLGYKKDMNINIAMSNLIANINKIIHDMPNNIILSLETAAGQGSQLGYTLEELTSIWNGVKHNNKLKNDIMVKRVGICIDTAHIFVGGYNISNIAGIKDYLDRFNRLIGWNNITNFHLNDSRYILGSRKDEHRGIGTGMIYTNKDGKKALKYLKMFCWKHNIPIVLETHGAGSEAKDSDNKCGYECEIKMLKNI